MPPYGVRLVNQMSVLLYLGGVLAAPCVIVVACMRSAGEMHRRAEGSEGTFGEAEPEGRAMRVRGWKRVGRLFLVMAAVAFVTWLVCDFRLRNWKSKQVVQNRINVSMMHDNLTALLDIGDEKLAREYVGFFGTNGCTLLDFDLMRTARGKELLERHLDWYVRIQELKEKRVGSR